METTGTERMLLVKGVAGECSSERIEVLIPHSDYRLHVRPSEGWKDVPTAGTRLRGIVRGEALRMHPLTVGGGRFIEPVIGEPRIISGVLRQVDRDARQVVIDAVVPFHLVAQADQSFEEFEVGRMVTCHVRSGLTFAPESAGG